VVSRGWYGSVQSLSMTGSLSLVFLAMFSIWFGRLRRGWVGPVKLGNLVA